MTDEATLKQSQEETTLELDSFESALESKFKPRTEAAKQEIVESVEALAKEALQGEIMPESVVNTVKGLIAALDEKISEQMNEVLHHDNFQKIESAWRGLHHFVMNTDSSKDQKIRVMPASKKELVSMFQRYPGAVWDQSPLFKAVYGQEYDQLGGEPYGCLVGDYYFDHSPQDVFLMQSLSKVAAASHAPFIAAAAPTTLQMDEWSDITKPTDLGKVMSTPEYAAWKTFRQSEDSRYMCLTLPRFLARTPYGAKSLPVEGFAYEESVSGDNAGDFCWANAAYAMAVNINRAFNEFGWCTRIRGVEAGGLVEGLPVYSFPSDDGGVEMTCPTEVAIGERREMELSNLGLLALVHRKNTDNAVFMGAQTVNEPKQYEDEEASSNAKLSARLPYIFASSRFAHYLKSMVRDKVGSNMERDELRRYLDKWVTQYVCDPEASTDVVKAKRPLSAAQVTVEDLPDNPGFYKATFHIRPHYQLEGMSISMRLVSKLPAA